MRFWLGCTVIESSQAQISKIRHVSCSAALESTANEDTSRPLHRQSEPTLVSLATLRNLLHRVCRILLVQDPKLSCAALLTFNPILYYAMLCYAMLCYTIPYYAMLCYALLYYTVLYYTILCYTLYYALYYILYYIRYYRLGYILYLRTKAGPKP